MPPLTLRELQEKLARLDVVELLELLNISSEDIVEAFVLRIEDTLETLEKSIDNYE